MAIPLARSLRHFVPRLCSACAAQSFDSHSLAQDDTDRACSVGAKLRQTPHPSPKGDTFSHWRRLKYRLLLAGWACREGTMLFAGSFRVLCEGNVLSWRAVLTQNPPPSRREAWLVWLAFGGLGLPCGCKACSVGYPTRTVVDAGPYNGWLALGGLGLLCECKALVDTSYQDRRASGYLYFHPTGEGLNIACS